MVITQGLHQRLFMLKWGHEHNIHLQRTKNNGNQVQVIDKKP